MGEQLFHFCELDFPFPLGPGDGRYLRRGPQGEEIAVITVRALHAPRRARMRRGRPVPSPPGATAPDPVPVTRVTVIAAEPFADAGAAAEWLERCRRSADTAGAEVARSLALVNVTVSAHRVAAQDPHVRDLVAADVLRARVGYGTGDEIVEGAWREAYVIPPARPGRRQRARMLSPQEEMAGILSGRRPGAWPSEELVLRARLDLEHGRTVEAALVARAAAEALAAEGIDDGSREAAARLADAALGEGMSADRREELGQLLAGLERTVRRRRYAEEG